MKRLAASAGLAVGVVLGYVGAVIAGLVGSKLLDRAERVDRGYVDFDGVECTEAACLGEHSHAHLVPVEGYAGGAR